VRRQQPPEPARTGWSHQFSPVLRAFPRGDRVGRPADQLPSVPSWPVSVDARRVRRRLRGDQAGPGAGGRRVAVRRERGQAGTEVLFYLALTVGLEDDPPDAVAGYRVREGMGAGPGRPVRVPGRYRDPRWGELVGVPLLQRGQVTVAVPNPRRLRAPAAVSGPGDRARGVRRRAAGVSEPGGDLPGAGVEMPEACYGVAGKTGDQLLPFTPSPAAGCPEDRVRPGGRHTSHGTGQRPALARYGVVSDALRRQPRPAAALPEPDQMAADTARAGAHPMAISTGRRSLHRDQ